MGRFTAIYSTKDNEERMVVFDVRARVMIDDVVRASAEKAIPEGATVIKIEMGDRR